MAGRHVTWSWTSFLAAAWQGPPPAKPLFIFGVLVILAAFAVAQVTALRRWRGLWRVAAAVPAGIMLLVVLRIVVLPHDQWLYEILTWCGISLGLLGLSAAARALAPRSEGGSKATDRAPRA